MKDIYIRTLCRPSILKNGLPVVFKRNKSLILIIYLHITEKEFRREELADFLWPELDAEHSKANLRTVLSECRTLLGSSIFIVDNQFIKLNQNITESDYHDFYRLAESGDINKLKEAEALYNEDFLKGLLIHRSSVFDDWQFAEQQTLELRYLDVLEKLIVKISATNDSKTAIHYLQKAMSRNPLNENFYHRLISLYADEQDYNSALHLYNNLVEKLKEEKLGEPDIRIQKLISKIKEKQKISEHIKPPHQRHISLPPKKLILILIITMFFVIVISTFHFGTSNQNSVKSISVAVLPFNFMCNDDNAQIFAECFTIEMINSLTTENNMEIKPAQTVIGYKETLLTIKEIGEELEVDYIIDGSAMSYDECIRFSVQLIDVESDNCIWTYSYNREVDSSLETQQEIIHALQTNLVQQLRKKISL